MKAVVVDGRIPSECAGTLQSLDFELILMPPWNRLSAPVSSHPDMLLFITGDTVICHAGYYAVARDPVERILSVGYRLILSDENCSTEYPHDILFNALPAGGYLYCLEKHLSGAVRMVTEKAGIRTVNVRQGYARCSACIVGENAVITSDVSLDRALREHGTDVLLISPGNIRLDGYPCGFIGGASGYDNENVYFAGNLALHPDADKIESFCIRHGKRAVSLSADPLTDIGTMFFI